MPPKRAQRFKLGSSQSADTHHQRKSLPAQFETENKDPHNTSTNPIPSKRSQIRKSLPVCMNGNTTPKAKESPRNHRATPRISASSTRDRRSSRNPTVKQSMNGSAQSSKTLKLSSYTTPDNPYNMHYYDMESLTSSEDSRFATPEVPSTRRRGFQSRPSRLSTVHTPAADSPSSSQGGRTTRRMAAFETPKNQFSDQEIPDTADTTEWTYDEYMSGFGLDGPMDRRASPKSATSGGTRTSARVRKPTIRAIEALESSRTKRRTRTPATKELVKAPTTEPKKEPTNEPINGFIRRVTSGRVIKNNKTPQTASSTKTSNSSKKLKATKKSAPKGLQIGITLTGKALYDLVLVALGSGFQAPSDAQQLIADKRREYNERGAKKESEAQTSADNTEAVATQNEETLEGTIEKFSKASLPQLDSDGWANTGRVNTEGEEVVLTPPGHSPYRSNHNYGDERLPAPPVRSQSDQQTETDRVWGYPPIVGDRNIPNAQHFQFQRENIADTRSKKKTRQDEKPSKDETKKPRSKRRRYSENEVTEVHAPPAATSTTKDDGDRKPKRRRRTEPIPAPKTKSPSSTTTKTTKSTNKSPTFHPPPKDEKPKLQRLRLTLKPETENATAAEGTTNKGKKRGTDALADETKAAPAASPKRPRVTFKGEEQEKPVPKSRPRSTSAPPARRGGRRPAK